ncbi:MAG: carbon starvation protein A [Candidatus Marinamargulisbacteria bacterium]
MNGLLIIVVTYIGFLLAYRWYGKRLGSTVFGLIASNKTPAHVHQDGHDFVPSKKGLVFGHHFTSIAGTGPIVGPAIGVIWGWLPALIWVVFGSIFMGAVHDLGALVVSLRHDGRSICDIANDLVSKRVQQLVFFIVCLALWIVIAIFGLVIAIIFHLFPESVGPVWAEIPIAIAFGFFVRRHPGQFKLISALAILAMCVVVAVGHWFPITMPLVFGIPATGTWTVLLLAYACIASVLPVQTLLQPRDYLNAWQLVIALGLLMVGAVVSGVMGKLTMVAPAVVAAPVGAPAMMPFLFITIACGAISGFHSLVASGTTSKQLSSESDAVAVGFGSMLVEGALAVMVIVACCAGIGMGYPTDGGSVLMGQAAWESHYASWGASAGLASKLHAVVVGAANMMTSLGVPQSLGIVIMGVFIASFAGTTLDTSTRLQRYMITELGNSLNIRFSTISATLLAVVTGALLAFSSGASGKGALQLWPLFGALNQLLASIGLGLITLYILKTRPRFVMVSAIPFLFMLVMTLWATIHNQWQFFQQQQWLLLSINSLVLFAATGICIGMVKRYQQGTLDKIIKI